MKISKLTTKLAITAAAISTATFVSGVSAQAQERTLSEVFIVATNFCPRGSAGADGQLLAISSNTALFSLIGTIYGGDGRTTFALPDLRGRAPIHTGNGPGLSSRREGERFGSERNTMTELEMPSHNHRAGVQTYDDAANSPTPRKNSFGVAPGNVYVSDEAAPSGKFMHADTVLVDPKGGSQSQNNLQPSLVLRYCVAIQGVFPSRS